MTTGEDEQINFADRITTVDKKGKRKWIYALQPKGAFYKKRTIISLVYLVLFFGLPFVRIDGVPLFLFNFPKATFIFFGKVFLPQDFMLLGVGMLTALLFVILFTLAFGRVFCGWACPQTIFMEMVFRRIEYWIEGPAHKQHVADKKKWTTEVYIRKIIKHVVFFVLSFVIANTFLSYIIGTDALFRIMREPMQEHVVGLLSIIGFTTAFYIVYAFIRELVCTVICPYGRLQSVLLDKNSLVVAYDRLRGEPRGKRKKACSSNDQGDCIDCGLCISVCPTGIDIRNGIQLECISCTACIDACNMMMLKVNQAPDLIKIASENSIISGKKERFFTRSKIYYSTALVALLIVLSSLIVSRSMFDATILRVPGQTLQENKDGTVSNLYRIMIVSKSMRTQPYDIAIQPKEASISFVGKHLDSLHSGIATEETFFIKVPVTAIKKRKNTFKILIMSGTQIVQTKEVTFLGEY
jgi:cytochrome c oxidase accessory protein FixG